MLKSGDVSVCEPRASLFDRIELDVSGQLFVLNLGITYILVPMDYFKTGSKHMPSLLASQQPLLGKVLID